MKNTKKMTEGSPLKLIFFFAVPLMIGSIFQQMYTLADTAIVGQLIGVEALAALGAADWMIWMVQGIVTGLAQGFSISVSQHYGASLQEELKKSTARSLVLIAFSTLFVLIVSQLTIKPILIFLNTPNDILSMTLIYIRIIFMGVPFIAAYQMFASLLRALGNSKTPLNAMLIASVINIVLDYIFVAYFHWGIAGAAIATIFSQLISALYCYRAVSKVELLQLEAHHFKKENQLDQVLFKLGFPMAAQNIIISIGGLCIQSSVNGYGLVAVAGFTATNKLYGLLELAAISYGFAVTTYVGQNHGAKLYERVKKGVRTGAILAILTSFIISILMLIFGKSLLALFISGENTVQVMEVAYQYLCFMAAMLWTLYLLCVYRSSLQGLGNTIIPMASGVVELILRISGAFVWPIFFELKGLMLAEVSAWVGAAILLFLSYQFITKNESYQ